MPLQGIVFLCGGLETNVVKQQQKDAHGALVYCGDPGRHWLLFTAANEIYYVISFAEIHEALDVKTEPFAAEMGEEEGGVEGRRHRRHRTKAR